jgi:hypothetical protein
MDEIRLLNEDEINDYLDIVANAFPMIKMETPKEKEKFRGRILNPSKRDFPPGLTVILKETS